jgi:hypothetical protein
MHAKTNGRIPHKTMGHTFSRSARLMRVPPPRGERCSKHKQSGLVNTPPNPKQRHQTCSSSTAVVTGMGAKEGELFAGRLSVDSAASFSSSSLAEPSFSTLACCHVQKRENKRRCQKMCGAVHVCTQDRWGTQGYPPCWEKGQEMAK